MIYELAVPGPIEEVEEVRVLEWHGAEGQAFVPGELVVELETHKALVEVRAGQSGVLRRIVCAEGAWQDVGKPLAVFSDTAGEPLPEASDGLTAWTVAFEVS
ncbi:MAG TPA: lipoyl domain-containing protein [Caulobacteraceae bacterium]|nr:lipoyl domain-containing protein [Caulobacteraceae bacterium]